MPAHNESFAIVDTIEALKKQKYPRFEIIVVNDGSTDNTAEILDEYQRRGEIRAIHLASNQGKAAAMRVATLASRYEILVCVDGDAVLDEHAVHWLARHFESPRVGAVTGNPRVRTRSTLLGKIQVGEFSSIIGLIKRAQRIYGRVFTVSGVVAAFRKTALYRVGFWDLNKITDDIDVSWRLQMDHWSIRFESNALCWILMPETVGGLWKQRLRWAQGGMEVAMQHLGGLFKWRRRHMWPVLLEFCLSVLWSYTMLVLGVSLAMAQIMELPALPDIRDWLPSWGGAIIGFDLSAAVRRGAGHRQPLREGSVAVLFLDHLVSDRLLVDQRGHYHRGRAQGSVPPPQQARGMGQSRPRGAVRCTAPVIRHLQRAMPLPNWMRASPTRARSLFSAATCRPLRNAGAIAA